jgi:hypothetical protein
MTQNRINVIITADEKSAVVKEAARRTLKGEQTTVSEVARGYIRAGNRRDARRAAN